MNLRQVLLAEYFAVDSDGKMYVGGGFNRIASPVFPAQFGEHHLVVVLDAIVGEPIENESVKVVLHGGEPAEVVAETLFTPPSPSQGSVDGDPVCLFIKANLNKLVVPSSGEYIFDIYVQGRLEQGLKMSARQESKEMR